MDEINEVMDYRQIKLFLMAYPLNFKSNHENVMLLISGFVHLNINDLYHKIPTDIIQFCIKYCCNFCDNYKEPKQQFKAEQCGDSAERVFGEFVFGIKTIRKVWKIKIIEVHTQIAKTEFQTAENL